VRIGLRDDPRQLSRSFYQQHAWEEWLVREMAAQKGLAPSY
jgi:hypothetical protein